MDRLLNYVEFKGKLLKFLMVAFSGECKNIDLARVECTFLEDLDLLPGFLRAWIGLGKRILRSDCYIDYQMVREYKMDRTLKESKFSRKS